ncbi:uncharacterized protein B0H64DRAFT_169180 [Chaetomium fimeti]|uniref:DUF6594 domain-containing protein n=1 Tax=Chaetomium fimeti TaxID=1854472 RepID=A0AAE0LSZ2_9PEZI|nr:hypothetical protein B0H64DRAFT_169180 [Chaetomium fimeti]
MSGESIQSLGPDLEIGLLEQNTPIVAGEGELPSNTRNANVELPERGPEPTTRATSIPGPRTPSHPSSLRPHDARSVSPSPSAASVPHNRRRFRAFPSRPTRPVRKTRRASSAASSRVSSSTPGSPRHGSPSLTNPSVRAGTIGPPSPPPTEGPVAVKGASVTLQARDAENQGKWAVEHHHKGLIHEVVGARKKSKQWLNGLLGITEPAPRERIFRVSFAEMQRLKLRKLQVKLVDHAIDMTTLNQESAGWERDLAQYTQAVKDYEYMLECTKLPQDYFYATGERAVDRYVISQLVGDFGRLGQASKTVPVELWSEENTVIGGTRNMNIKKTRMKAFRDRLSIATIGGALLVGPMWLMMLRDGLYTRLITTTVCVALLALLASWRLEKSDQVLQATAAYAAVLVVFVGLTNSGS